MSAEESYLILFLIFAVHLTLFVNNFILKTYMVLPYINLLKTLGVEIHFFQIKWFTTSFNRYIQKIGLYRTKLQYIWFNVGTWFTVLTLPLASFFVIQSLYSLFVNWKWENKNYVSDPFLKPVVVQFLSFSKELFAYDFEPLTRDYFSYQYSDTFVQFPGINMPISDVGYYVVTLVICTVYHELGHAMVAVREGVRITGVGLTVILIVPICYVKMEGVETLTAFKQLKMFSAGVWHNIVLSAFAICTLLSIPWILYPFYEYGAGIQVKFIQQDSTLYGPGGLKPGDIITKVSRCAVSNEYSWVNCIMHVVRNPVNGYCLDSEFVHEHDESIAAKVLPYGNVECCRSNTSSHLCFEYLEQPNDPVELPQYSCLAARMVVNNGKFVCRAASDCISSHCLRPSLDNSTKLVEIKRKGEDIVLFLGHPIEIYRSIKISEFIENTILPSSVPESLGKFCDFLVMVSAAFAILNTVPCFYLDGQHIVRALVNVCLIRTVKLKTVRLAIALAITIIGTVILVSYMTLILFSIFVR